MKATLHGQPVSITADETTDIRDHSILNVIATVRGQPYLIDVVKMDACNHSTFSKAIIQSVTGAGISFDDVIAIVSDSAAYWKKAYRDVLTVVFPKSTHILCLAHIVNLAAEVFHHHGAFKHTADLVAMIKSSLFKKPGRKSRYLAYLSEYIATADVKLPPVPVSSRWNSWFETVKYHATRVHLYEGFYKAEKGVGMAVQHIIELLSHKTLYPEITLQLYFLSENCLRLMIVLTALEENTAPLTCKVFNYLEDLRLYLQTGSQKTSFGVETDRLLLKMSDTERRKWIKSFQEVFQLSSKKLGHLSNHPAYAYYKAVRIFDPQQLAIVIVEHYIIDYLAIHGLQSPSADLHEECLGVPFPLP